MFEKLTLKEGYETKFNPLLEWLNIAADAITAKQAATL